MSKPINNRPNTISQPQNAASVSELSAEAMDDINSISAGEFSTIQPSNHKRNQRGALKDLGSLPPLEDNRNSISLQRESLAELSDSDLNNFQAKRAESFDNDTIDIDSALSLDDDSKLISSFGHDLDDDDANIVDIELDMDGISATPRSKKKAQARKQESFNHYQAHQEADNSGLINGLPPFSALDSQDPNQAPMAGYQAMANNPMVSNAHANGYQATSHNHAMTNGMGQTMPNGMSPQFMAQQGMGPQGMASMNANGMNQAPFANQGMQGQHFAHHAMGQDGNFNGAMPSPDFEQEAMNNANGQFFDPQFISSDQGQAIVPVHGMDSPNLPQGMMGSNNFPSQVGNFAPHGAEQGFIATQNQGAPSNSMLPPFVAQGAMAQDSNMPFAYDNNGMPHQGFNNSRATSQAMAHNNQQFGYERAAENDHFARSEYDRAPAHGNMQAMASAENKGNDPFSDPAFLAAQTAKPSFYQDKAHKRTYSHQNHGEVSYISPGVHPKNVDDIAPDAQQSYVFDKEEVERRTKEIWGNDSGQGNLYQHDIQANHAQGAMLNQGIYQDKAALEQAQMNAQAQMPYQAEPNSQVNTISHNQESAGNMAQNNLKEEEPPLRLLNPDAPSTLINGYVYDLQNKSQAEVRSGLDRIIQKTSQAMLQTQEERARSNDGTILASDMFKGSRYEQNISKFNRNNQVNTKISGLVAKYNAAKQKSLQANANQEQTNPLANQIARHESNKFASRANNYGDVSTVISQGTSTIPTQYDANGQVPQSAFAGTGSKNYKTIMSDSNNRLVAADNFGRTSRVGNHHEGFTAIDFSFGSKANPPREPSSVSNNGHTQVTKFGEHKEQALEHSSNKASMGAAKSNDISPTVNIDSMLMPANSSPLESTNKSASPSHGSIAKTSSLFEANFNDKTGASSSFGSVAPAKAASKSTTVDLSSFNFDLDKDESTLLGKGRSFSSVSQVASDSHDISKLRDEIKSANRELDSLLPSLDDNLEDASKTPRCKLFDAPDLFECTHEHVNTEDGPLKIKPDFYTTSNDKPAIVDINPLENPNDVSTKVDHKNLDMELPELKDDKSLHTFESLSGLKDLGQALRSLADSLQPPAQDDDFNPLSAPPKGDPKFKISNDKDDDQPIDAFSNLMASADERFGNKQAKSSLKQEQDKKESQASLQAPLAKAQAPHGQAPAPEATASGMASSQGSAQGPAHVQPQSMAPNQAQAMAPGIGQGMAPGMAQGQSMAFGQNQAPRAYMGANSTQAMLSPYLMRAKSLVSQCQYLQHAGLDLNTIERFNLGFDAFYRVDEANINSGYMANAVNWPALIVPLNEDSFVAFNSATLLQNPTGEPERRYVGQGPCFNLKLLNGSVIDKPLFICANELDALALESLGCSALALGMPYNVMMVLTCLQNLCNNQDIKNIIKAPCYLCLPSNNQIWQGAQEALVSAFQTLQLPASVIDLTCSCPSINQALVFNKNELITKTKAINESYQASLRPNASLNIASGSLSNTNGLVLSLENLAKLELSNTLYALSSSSISLSRLVLASLVENKYRPLVYAGSAMQWQMLCSLVSSNQGLAPIENTPLKQLIGYKAKFLEMPWEMNLSKIDETIRAGLQAQSKSKEGSCALMVDTFSYDQTLCTSLAPRFAQLAMEFNTPIVVWCTQEQKNIFSGNAFQSIEMAQGSPNEIIFRTIDNACRLHMFSTGK